MNIDSIQNGYVIDHIRAGRSIRLRTRHRIEEKNGEMKTAHGFRKADSAGLVAIRLQAYFTAIVVNMKRIVTVIPG